MVTATSESEPIAPTLAERSALEDLQRQLADLDPCCMRLLGPMGAEVRLPESAARALREAVEALARGQAVLVERVPEDLTTQEAASILNVPRSHLIDLLDQQEIPSGDRHGLRRVRFDDLMAYKRRRDAARRTGLAELTRLSQELGLYDE